VSTGSNHTCALRSSGTVACWGDNTYGEAPASQAPPPGTSFTEVSAGTFDTCALVSDGTAVCWGLASAGQVPAPAPPANQTFTQVSAGDFFVCALVSDGTVGCWGANGFGQAPASRAPPEGKIFTQVSAAFANPYGSGGLPSTCALVSDGTVSCWGGNSFGKAPASRLPPEGKTFTQVSAGSDHTCALVSDGALDCFGENVYGQSTPPAGTTFTQVSGGSSYSCAVKSDGTLACWGRDENGETTPPEGTTFTQVDAGDFVACALRSDGTVACWGQAGEQSTPPAGLNLLATPPPPGSTPIGSGVAVTPVDPTTNTSPATLTFADVTVAGTTTLTTSGEGAPPPQSFQLGAPPVYYQLQTTATFTGLVTLCIDYSGTTFAGAGDLRLLHGSTDGTWTDVTTTSDPGTTTICGTVSSLSPFIVARFHYAFQGFLQPVDNPEIATNTAKAGSSIPVRFKLGGNQGLSVFKNHFPQFVPSPACNTTSLDAIETTSANPSGLTYEVGTGTYTYVWKGDKAWAGRCGTFELGLKDGSDHPALFKFTK
jgi:hypothetical protein